MVLCIAPFVHPNCQEGCLSFAFICYPQDTKCCQPAVVCSISHLLSPFPSLPHSLRLPVSHSSGKTADRCGRRRGRWQGWQERLLGEEMKIRRCEEKDASSTNTYMQAHTFYFSVSQPHKLQLCWCTHAHSAYALYNKPFWCFGLEANRHAGECDSL